MALVAATEDTESVDAVGAEGGGSVVKLISLPVAEPSVLEAITR